MNPPAGGGPRPLGTLLYVPLLYGTGWMLARSLAVQNPAWRADQIDLIGAVVALLLLLFLIKVLTQAT